MGLKKKRIAIVTSSRPGVVLRLLSPHPACAVALARAAAVSVAVVRTELTSGDRAGDECSARRAHGEQSPGEVSD
jgi:hypothetical protein